MNRRRLIAVPGILVLGLAPAAGQAQRLPSLSPTTSKLEIVSQFGTATEATLLKSATTRLTDRFTTDATFAQRLEDALKQRRSDDARRLVLGATQVTTAAADIVYPDGTVGDAGTAGDASIQPVAYHPARGPAAFTPWYFIVRTPWAFVVVCDVRSECKKGWQNYINNR